MKKFYDDKLAALMQPSQKRYVSVPQPEGKVERDLTFKNVGMEDTPPLTSHD